MTAPVARAGADLRMLRAAVFTAVCVALSAAGHVLAAGATVPWWSVAAAVAVVFAVAAPLAGRERTLPGIAAALAAGQTALHFLFATAQTGPAPAPAEDRGGLLALARSLVCNDRAATMTEAEAHRVVTDAGLSGSVVHGGHTLPAGDGTSAAACLEAVVRTALAMASGPMLLGHVLAALGAGWLLRRGEAALWRLVRLSAAACGELLPAALRTALALACALHRGTSAADLPTVRGGVGTDRVALPTTGAPPSSVSRRGPPAAPGSFVLTA
ncbi:hypothetical protein QNO07_16390 [Streptomyces sp. 549]|uniref:hypothetical protein n=1 Tax=Streptomyces sp. 549 TaxID=3049076 RepID=UPI0024C374CD|nr:hypothetical protein [Streptomyces sp. 549]MDK1474976.1 hypothetical protein [Streptomyces sp. 549]